MDKYPSALLKMVLHLEWDVLQALHIKLKWFLQQPTIDWLKSHQDDNPNIALPIPVQLNIHADEFTTIGLNILPSKPHVHLDHLVEAQLNFDGGTITWNIPYILRK